MSCEFDSKNKSTTEPAANINKSNKKDADFEYRAAVMDFRPNGDLTSKDVEGISLIFATYFHPEGYTMIERAQIETVLKEQGIQKSQITEQQMVDIGKIMNLSYIVIGDVTLHMDEYNVDVRLVSVEKGKIIASEGATLSKNEGTYRQYLGKIANNLSAKVPTKPVVKTVIKKETEGKKFDDVIVLYDYFKVFPNDLGYFDALPSTIIDKINEAEQYGYCTWRIPTKEELSLLRSNNIIPPDIDYIASYSSTYSGRVRLVTDDEPCMEYKARKIEEEQKRLEAEAEAERIRIIVEEEAKKEVNERWTKTVSMKEHGLINGIFSVCPNGKVYFSKGNLQCLRINTEEILRFADNQWDVIGKTSTYNDYEGREWIDLFGWGTGKYPHETSDELIVYSEYNEWGNNSIDNGGEVEWRTLKNEEWYYVFNERKTNSGIRYAKAQVNGVNGVILFPDDWDSSKYKYTMNNTNNANASFNSNCISLSDWVYELEVYGLVFLPAAGHRRTYLVDNVNSLGYYWSATYYDSWRAFDVGFNDEDLNTSVWSSREFGLSVRLVSDVE